MNGRIYDPTLGRFMQADPIIQAPNDSQSYNRYSYVRNNPLSLTDPSGYSWWTKFRDKWLKPIVAIVVSIYLPGAISFLTGITNTVALGAITGFVAGGISTGTLKGALVGAFSGAIFGQLHNMAPGAGKVISHGIAGGVSSVLNGGKFGHGFLSAGFTQALGNVKGLFKNAPSGWDRVGNAIKAAVIGGASSAITGGKFASGAVTGAFSRLLNDDIANSRVEKLAEKLKWSKSQVKRFGNLMSTLNKMGENIENSESLDQALHAMTTDQLNILAKHPNFSETGVVYFKNKPDLIIDTIMYYNDKATFIKQLGLAGDTAMYAQKALYISPIAGKLISGTPMWFQNAYGKYSDAKFVLE